MFTKTFSQLINMRPALRSMVFLYWIQSFAGGLVGVFIQIFLYQKFSSVSLNLVATIIFFTGIMIGFCVPGYLASLWKWNLKNGFFLSFIVLAGAILYFLHVTNTRTAYLAMFFWGIGQGILWLTINTFELSETKDGERDFYSSVLNAGTQILSLVGPATATLLIWISGSVLHWGTFTLLFSAAPLVYLLGFFCFSSLRDYFPEHIRWADVVHFFTDRRNQVTQLYAMGGGFQDILGTIVPPLAILFILGTALRVGIYDTFFAIFSAFCILLVARYRTASNRLLIYGFTSLGIIAITIWFGLALTFVSLVLYTIIEGILSPLNRISQHVIDLHTMEIGRKESDFYATMILRDFFLWIWRALGGFIFLSISIIAINERQSLSTGLYLLAGSLAIAFFGAFLLYRKK